MRQMKFEEIYEEFQPKILNYLARLIGPDETEDTAQEVFARDKPAAIMKEAADALTGLQLADPNPSPGGCPAEKLGQAEIVN